MAIVDYTDAHLKAKLSTAYLLALEAGDVYIPHDPSEWEGLDRLSAYRDMVELVEELEAECARRKIDPAPYEREAEIKWESKHGEWT